MIVFMLVLIFVAIVWREDVLEITAELWDIATWPLRAMSRLACRAVSAILKQLP